MAVPLEHHEPDLDGRRPMTAGRAAVTVVLTLLVGALACAPAVERAAERQGYGRGRDLLLDVARPLASLSHDLWLDRPREWLASLTDHGDPPRATAFGTGVTVPSTNPTTSVPTTTTTTAPVPVIAPAVPTTAAPFVPLPGPARRTPSTDQPLTLWMGGDSLMGTISEQLSAAWAGDGRVRVTTDVQVSTGLARPDVLDWAAELQAQMESAAPDVVVLSFGGNDDQPLHAPDGTYCSLFTPEWQAEYARRAGLMMDVASAGGSRTVVWLGLPAERPENLNGAKEAMNAAARAEAAKRPGVVYVDLGPPLAGADGGYTDQVARPDGSTVSTRTSDGVHLTEEGAALVAPLINDAFAAEWHLR